MFQYPPCIDELVAATKQRQFRDVEAHIKRYQDKQVSYNYFEKSVSWETFKTFSGMDSLMTDFSRGLYISTSSSNINHCWTCLSKYVISFTSVQELQHVDFAVSPSRWLEAWTSRLKTYLNHVSLLCVINGEWEWENQSNSSRLHVTTCCQRNQCRWSIHKRQFIEWLFTLKV